MCEIDLFVLMTNQMLVLEKSPPLSVDIAFNEIKELP